MKAIIKNELKKYFYSPLGYIVIGGFLVIFSLYVLSGIVSYLTLDLGIALYYTIELGFPVIIGLLTMGMFAEERKNGTEKLLLTSPISTFKIVLAKFFSAMIVCGIGLLITLIHYFIFRIFGEYSFVEALTQILGVMFVAAAGISFGMFASSLVDNPVIAGAITIITMELWTILASNVGINNMLFSITHLSALYINFGRGVISIADILILCLFTVLFFTLTLLSFKRRRLVK